MSIRRSLAFSFLEKYASTAINLASTLIIARLLTPEEIGVFSVGAAVVGLMHALRDFGVTNYLIQERVVDQEKLRTAFTVTLVLSWLFAAVLLAGGGWAAEFYDEDGVREIVWVMAANFVLIPFGAPILALMRRDLQFGRIAAIQLTSTAVNAGAGIILAALGFGFMSLAWASLAGVAVTSGLAFLSRPHAFLLRPGVGHLRSVLAFGGYATSTALIGDLRMTAPSLILGRLLGFEAVGLYSRAIGLLTIFNKLVFEGLQPVLLPALSEKVRRGEDLAPVYLKAMEYVTALHWPFLVFLAAMADPIIFILLGEQWGAVAPLVRIFCGAAALGFPGFLSQPLLIAVGRIRDTLTIQLVVAPVSIAAILVGSLHSLAAVAMASYVPAVVGLAITLAIVRRAVRFEIGDFGRCLVKSAMVTAISALVPLAALAWNGWRSEMPVATFLLSGALYSAVWIAALFVTRHPLAFEVSRVFRSLRRYRS